MIDPIEHDKWLAHLALTEVTTLAEKKVTLRELWRDKITVTTFLRHFGCIFCHQVVADVVAAAPEIVERGGRVIFIGNGSVNQAKRFSKDKRLPRDGCDVVTDPDRTSFEAAELHRGYGRTFNAASVRAYGQAKKVGHAITGLFGDLTQLGGLIVTRPPSRFVYMHRSEHAGDHPDMKEVLEMITNITLSVLPPA